jgi:putative transposase
MPGSFASLNYHVVFSTKDRLPLISADLAPDLHAYLGGTARAKGDVALRVGGMADHVHVLLSLPGRRAVADAIRDLKANSSRWVRETYPGLPQFAWQEGYAAFTVGVSGLAQVRGYIENQEIHHREVTFQEEFAAFLKRHGLEFDERYLWR